jgi:hypothetical protein
MLNQFRITESTSVLQIQSEPYVIYSKFGYVPVLDVEEIHKGQKGYILISASSLGEALNKIQCENQGLLAGVTVSIQKESASRMARYIVERLD